MLKPVYESEWVFCLRNFKLKDTRGSGHPELSKRELEEEETAHLFQVRHLIVTEFCEAKSNVHWTFGEDTRGSGHPELSKRELEEEETAHLFQVRHLIVTEFCEAKSNVQWTFGEDTRGSGHPELSKRELEDRFIRLRLIFRNKKSYEK